jgi:hypothetical protein
MAVERQPPPFDRDALVKAEVERVNRFMKDTGARRSVNPEYASVEAFVLAAFEAHLPLIEKWHGWTFEPRPDKTDRVHTNTVRAAWTPVADFPPVEKFVAFCSKAWVGGDEEVEYARGLTVKVRNGQILSRVILRDVVKRYGKDTPYSKAWEKFFERLGHAWAGDKAIPSAISLTCAPSSFLALGHVGENSCYANGGQFYLSKYNLPLMRNSIVGFVHTDDEQRKKAWTYQPGLSRVAYGDKTFTHHTVGRFWGFALDTGALITNRYRFEWNTYMGAITEAFRQHYGKAVAESEVPDYPERHGDRDDYRKIREDHPLADLHGGPSNPRKQTKRYIFIDLHGRLLAVDNKREALLADLREMADYTLKNVKMFSRR